MANYVRFQKVWMDDPDCYIEAPDLCGDLEVSSSREEAEAICVNARELFALLTIHFEAQPLTFSELSEAYYKA